MNTACSQLTMQAVWASGTSALVILIASKLDRCTCVGHWSTLLETKQFFFLWSDSWSMLRKYTHNEDHLEITTVIFAGDDKRESDMVLLLVGTTSFCMWRWGPRWTMWLPWLRRPQRGYSPQGRWFLSTQIWVLKPRGVGLNQQLLYQTTRKELQSERARYNNSKWFVFI